MLRSRDTGEHGRKRKAYVIYLTQPLISGARSLQISSLAFFMIYIQEMKINLGSRQAVTEVEQVQRSVLLFVYGVNRNIITTASVVVQQCFDAFSSKYGFERKCKLMIA